MPHLSDGEKKTNPFLSSNPPLAPLPLPHPLGVISHPLFKHQRFSSSALLVIRNRLFDWGGS